MLKPYPTYELTLHPSAKLLPAVAPDSGEFKALLNLIGEGGMAAAGRHILTHAFRVVGNADLWEAAKLLGMAKVECIELPADVAPESVMVADLTSRRQWTKGQVAYLTVPVLEPMLANIKRRLIANLRNVGKKGGDSSQVVENVDPALSAGSTNADATLLALGAHKLKNAKTVEAIAEALGISERLFRMARQIHIEFAAKPELKAHFEPSILGQDENGSIAGLGGVIAGIASFHATKGITPMIQPELNLWQERIQKRTSPVHWQGWDKVSPESRAALADHYAAELMKSTPDEVTAAIERAAAKRLGIPYTPKIQAVS